MRGEGPARVRRSWGFNGSRPFESVFFQFFSGEFLEGRLELFFTFFVSFPGLLWGLFCQFFANVQFSSKKCRPPFFVYSTAFWLDLQGWGASKI